MTVRERQRAEKILHDHEEKAVAASRLNPGARETLTELHRRGIRVGVLTRNRKRNAEAVAAMHHLDFDAIVGREDGPVKPDAFGVRHLCQRFGVEPSETLLVGDYLFDLLCARAAGATPVWITNQQHGRDFSDQADFHIDELTEILSLLDRQHGTKGPSSEEETSHV